MTMEASSAVAEEPHYTLENINSSHSYSTDAQSVQSGVTHGTAPSVAQSPARTTTTPLSLSPSSHTIKSTHKIKDAAALPQFRDRSQNQEDVQLTAMEQEWEALEQQQMLESALSRQRTNPASDDDETEPSSSANTGEHNELTFNNENNTDTKGYTRSDSNTGATSTFGRLVKSAAKVSLSFFEKCLELCLELFYSDGYQDLSCCTFEYSSIPFTFLCFDFFLVIHRPKRVSTTEHQLRTPIESSPRTK